MKDRLILQSCDDNFLPYLELSRPVHERYASACDADYLLHVGLKDHEVHPAWNRLPMFLDAFHDGYRKVVWLDADSLVVNPDVDIFTETDDIAPWQMIRILDSHVEMPWGEPGWDAYNDGVWVANNCVDAVEAIDWVWSKRRTPFLEHHHPQMWECNWVNDWAFAHPEDMLELDVRFNWMDFRENEGIEPVVRSFHGIPREPRFLQFVEAYYERWAA